MSSLGQIACVFLSFMGSIYCLWILYDCWKQARASREAGEPPAVRSRRKATTDRIEWHCQILFAGMFLAVALVLITGNVRHVLSHLVPSRSGSVQQTGPVSRLAAQEFPAIFFDRDSTRPGRPAVGIDCNTEPVSDELVRNMLRESPEVEWLTLTQTRISDDLLRDLSDLCHLKALNLDDTEVSDCGLAYLSDLEGLEELSLTGTRITNIGLQRLAGLRSLRGLYLSNTAVTDDGLRALAKLSDLMILDLRGTAITDPGLEHLAALPGLEYLLIENTEITKAGLRQLAEMRNLTVLGLRNTAITDRGTRQLWYGE